MDYPCAEFGDCIFSHFGFIVWTSTQTHTPLNALLMRLSSARVNTQNTQKTNHWQTNKYKYKWEFVERGLQIVQGC